MSDVSQPQALFIAWLTEEGVANASVHTSLAGAAAWLAAEVNDLMADSDPRWVDEAAPAIAAATPEKMDETISHWLAQFDQVGAMFAAGIIRQAEIRP